MIKSAYATSKLGFKVAIKYRFNFIVAFLTVPISITIFFLLWESIFAYSNTEILRGFSFPQMVSYYVVSSIVGFFIFSEPDKWMSDDVRRGQVIRDLLKPLSYFSQWIFFEIGLNSFGILTEMVPVFIVGFLFFNLHLPPMLYFITFFISVAFAFLITYLLGYLIGLASFWLKQVTGLRRVKRALLFFLSGGLIPLAFFPPWLEKLSFILPFAYIRYVPINIYLVNYTPAELFVMLAIQIAWIIALYIAMRILMGFALKQIAGAGT